MLEREIADLDDQMASFVEAEGTQRNVGSYVVLFLKSVKVSTKEKINENFGPTSLIARFLP